MNRVCVLIPTLRRPAELMRAVRSVIAQTGAHARPDSLVVVDNDPEASARSAVAALTTQAPFPIHYVHEPRPGVATARNAGLAATQAELIAFLDDDEIASPNWLTALVETQDRLQAPVVFGPIRGLAPDAPPWLQPYLERFFGRDGPQEDRLIEHPFGCGNTLFVRHLTLRGDTPFDVSTDQTGGEDDALFQSLSDQGLTFGWAANAWVDETAPSHRANLSYALKRAFAYGQGPSQDAARRGDWLGVVRWMLIGTGQGLVYGAAAALKWLTRSSDRADWSDKAARGLGKLLWMKPFEPKLYGLAEITRARGSA